LFFLQSESPSHYLGSLAQFVVTKRKAHTNITVGDTEGALVKQTLQDLDAKQL